VEKRADEYQKRGAAWQRLNASLNHVFETVNNTWPVAKPWLTEEQLHSVWGQYNRTKTWLEDKFAQQLNRSDDVDPAVSVAEIDTQKLLLEWNFNSTDRLRKPTPTPVPTPEPEVNETGSDADAEPLGNEPGSDADAGPSVNEPGSDADAEPLGNEGQVDDQDNESIRTEI
jgi:hypothetical protein